MAQENHETYDSRHAMPESVSPRGTIRTRYVIVLPNSVPPRHDNNIMTLRYYHDRREIVDDNFSHKTGHGCRTNDGIVNVLDCGNPTSSGIKRQRDVGNPTLFKCYLCNRVFGSKQGLCAHMRVHKSRVWRGINAPPLFSRVRVVDLDVKVEEENRAWTFDLNELPPSEDEE